VFHDFGVMILRASCMAEEMPHACSNLYPRGFLSLSIHGTICMWPELCCVCACISHNFSFNEGSPSLSLELLFACTLFRDARVVDVKWVHASAIIVRACMCGGMCFFVSSPSRIASSFATEFFCSAVCRGNSTLAVP
jgi:hypothetical protein